MTYHEHTLTMQIYAMRKTLTFSYHLGPLNVWSSIGVRIRMKDCPRTNVSAVAYPVWRYHLQSTLHLRVDLISRCLAEQLVHLTHLISFNDAAFP